MITGVLLYQLAITRQGQQVFFEVAIPADISRITGIETSVSAMNAIGGTGTRRVAGSLRLQAEHTANRCYHTEVVLGNSPLENTVHGFPTATNPALVSLWTVPWSGGTYRDPERISITGCSTLYGNYTDEVGALLAADITYTVNLYIWTERNEPTL
jgi:hypothetical protein